MRDPVFGRIFCQRGALDDPFVDVTIQMKKTSETGLTEDGVGGSGKDLIVREVPQSPRHQELLYGEMRKLYDL
jgi:hypothetical protein